MTTIKPAILIRKNEARRRPHIDSGTLQFRTCLQSHPGNLKKNRGSARVKCDVQPKPPPVSRGGGGTSSTTEEAILNNY